MWNWNITIEAWPYSTGNGADADQKAAGDREQCYYVSAESIAEAITLARCIVDGIQSNPAVWQAPITGITRVKN